MHQTQAIEYQRSMFLIGTYLFFANG